MFFSVITKNSNWDILTNWDILAVRFLGGVRGFTKSQYGRGDCLKEGGLSSLQI